MVSSDGFRGLMFLVVKVRAGWGGHDRVGPLGVAEGMLLLSHAVPLVVVGAGGAGSSLIGQPGWGVGRFGSHAPPRGGLGRG